MLFLMAFLSCLLGITLLSPAKPKTCVYAKLRFTYHQAPYTTLQRNSFEPLCDRGARITVNGQLGARLFGDRAKHIGKGDRSDVGGKQPAFRIEHDISRRPRYWS